MPAKSGSPVSCGPGSVMFDPLILRASKSGGGAVPDVEITGGDETIRGLRRMTRPPRRNAAQIDKAIAFNVAQTLRKPIKVSECDLRWSVQIITICRYKLDEGGPIKKACKWPHADRASTKITFVAAKVN